MGRSGIYYFNPNHGIESDMTMDKYESKLSPEGDLIFSSWIAFVVVLSILSNGMCIKIFHNRWKKLSPVELLLCNLLLVNIFMSVTTSFCVPSGINHGWVYGDVGCWAYAASIVFFAIVHLTNLVSIAVLRYLQVCRHSIVVTKTTAYKALLLTYLAPAFLVAIPFTGILGDYDAEPAGLSCSLKWYGGDERSKAFVLLICVVGIALPFIIISCSYYKIYKIVAKSKAALGDRSAIPDSWVTRISVYMILAYAISWTPFGVAVLYSSCTDRLLIPARLTPHLSHCLPISWISTPIIYILLNEGYREELKVILGIKQAFTSLEQQQSLHA